MPLRPRLTEDQLKHCLPCFHLQTPTPSLPAKNDWPYDEEKYNLPVIPGLTEDTHNEIQPVKPGLPLPAKQTWPYGAEKYDVPD